MATPRKHWFRVADSVAFEPWSNDVAATFMRLLAYLNTRWARDGRSGIEAGSIVLSRSVAEQLTGSGSLARARSILHALAAHVSLTVTEHGTTTTVEWPKSAIFQRWAPESGETVEHVAPPDLPPPQDAPARRKTPPQDAVHTSDASGAAESVTPELVSADPDPLTERASELATLLRDEILRVDPRRKVPRSVTAGRPAWAKTLRLMLTADERDPDEIEAAIRWHFTRAGLPYALEIWSADTLRAKYDRLRSQASRERLTAQSSSSAQYDEGLRRFEAKEAERAARRAEREAERAAEAGAAS